MAKEKNTPDNLVHVSGFVNSITSNEIAEGKKAYNFEVVTREGWKDEKGEFQKKDTFHKLNLITDNKKVIKSVDTVAKDLATNEANRMANGSYKKGFEPAVRTISCDGKLITRQNEKDGVTFNNMLVVINEETLSLGTKLDREQTMNKATFKGNIASIDKKDGLAIIRVATHYYVPGESVNKKGEKVNYEERTSFIDTRMSEKRFGDTVAKLGGEIGVGDLVRVSGQMHNSKYADEVNNVTRYKMAIDLTSIELIAKKKAVKEEAKAEVKAEAKPQKAISRKGRKIS